MPKDVGTDYIEEVLGLAAVRQTGEANTGLGYAFESREMSIEQQDLIDLPRAIDAQLSPRTP